MPAVVHLNLQMPPLAGHVITVSKDPHPSNIALLHQWSCEDWPSYIPVIFDRHLGKNTMPHE